MGILDSHRNHQEFTVGQPQDHHQKGNLSGLVDLQQWGSRFPIIVVVDKNPTTTTVNQPLERKAPHFWRRSKQKPSQVHGTKKKKKKKSFMDLINPNV